MKRILSVYNYFFFFNPAFSIAFDRDFLWAVPKQRRRDLPVISPPEWITDKVNHVFCGVSVAAAAAVFVQSARAVRLMEPWEAAQCRTGHPLL